MAGHVVESLLELLGHERQLADAPDLGVLSEVCVSHSSISSYILQTKAYGRRGMAGNRLTGLRFFLSSTERVPALRAMIGGAASGSW